MIRISYRTLAFWTVYGFVAVVGLIRILAALAVVSLFLYAYVTPQRQRR